MNTKTILITGARSAVALDLARTFHRVGFRVICADSMKLSICRFSNAVSKFCEIAPPQDEFDQFVMDLKEIVDVEKVDLLVPTCEEILYVAKAKDHLNTRVFSEEFQTLDLLHNKWTFYKFLSKLGVTTPETHLSEEGAMREGNWIQKPVYSRFGVPVEQSGQKETIDQAFVEGEGFCSYTVCHGGRIVAHTIYRVHHKMGVGAGICVEVVEDSEIDEAVSTIVSSLSFTGQIAFDFIRGKKLHCIECNPRSTTGLHLFERSSQFAFSFWGDTFLPIAPKLGTLFREPLLMLWFGVKQGEVLTGRFWRHFFRGKNPIWDRKDWGVMTAIPIVLLNVAKMAIKKRMGLQQVMTMGIEYNGEVAR